VAVYFGVNNRHPTKMIIASTIRQKRNHKKNLQQRQQLRLSQPPGEVAWGGAWGGSEKFFEALSAGKGLSLIIISPG
jgi:hypothetical protein